MNGVNAEAQGKKKVSTKNNHKVRKTFYKNKFRCRMFVPIDDNYLQRTYNRVSRERTRKNDAKATEENSERS